MQLSIKISFELAEPELSMGWVDPRVGLGWVRSGMGRKFVFLVGWVG